LLLGCKCGELELAQVIGVADDFDGDDLSFGEGEAEHAEEASFAIRCRTRYGTRPRALRRAAARDTGAESIAMTNFWNRLNITTRQVAGEWMKSAEARRG
jgi:hypothetical protein